MEYQTFSEIILLLKHESERTSKLNKLGVDLIDFNDGLHRIITLLVKEIYGQEGYDWFSWFCYESDFGEKDWSQHECYKVIEGKTVKIHDKGEVRYGATDENDNPICYSIKSTWEYLEQNHKKI
jgi:hypothetical protein